MFKCPLLVVAGDVVTAADSLSSDTSKQDSCSAVSDANVGSQEDTLISSCNQFSTTTCVSVTAPVVTGVTAVSDSPASISTSDQSEVESILTNLRNLPVGCWHAVSVAENTDISLSPSSHSTTVLGSTAVSGNPAMSENNAVLGNTSISRSTGTNVSSPQTMTVNEYCRAFEQWTWQYYWWMQHVQWMTWAAYMSAPMYAGANCIPSTITQSMAQATVTSAAPAARAAAFQQQPPQQQQMQQPRGNSALLANLCSFTSSSDRQSYYYITTILHPFNGSFPGQSG